VTNTPDAEENYPCLSKDGKRIVYEMRSVAANATDTEIWTKNLQTNEKTMLGTGRMPSYSPDGSSIVYVKYTEDGWNTTLWIMNLSSGSQTQVTDANMGVVWNPRFSPDGRKIIFQCAKQQKKDFDLYTIDTNGNNLTQLTINESYDGEPYWTSDGYIYFTSDRGGRDGNYQIWRFKVKVGPIPPPVDYHIVKSGENINQIANRYHVTVKDLVKENGLSTMTLTPGQKLRIPSSR
jgi:TolB protein